MIRESFEKNKEFSLHSLASQYYRLYLAIGGMPRAILEYKEKQDMNFVAATLNDINNSYIADMAKYTTPTETTKIIKTIYKKNIENVIMVIGNLNLSAKKI